MRSNKDVDIFEEKIDNKTLFKKEVYQMENADLGFEISIARMLESNGQETFSLYITRPDMIGKSSLLNQKGMISAESSHNIDHIRFSATEWAIFFGVPLENIQDSFKESHPEDESNKEMRLEFAEINKL